MGCTGPPQRVGCTKSSGTSGHTLGLEYNHLLVYGVVNAFGSRCVSIALLPTVRSVLHVSRLLGSKLTHPRLGTTERPDHTLHFATDVQGEDRSSGLRKQTSTRLQPPDVLFSKVHNVTTAS